MTGGGFGGPGPFGSQPGPGPQGPPPPQQSGWGANPGPQYPQGPAGGQQFGAPPLPPPPAPVPQWGAGPPQPGPYGAPPQFAGGGPGYIPMPTPKPARKPFLRLPSTKRGRRILLGAGAGVVAVALIVGGVVVFSGGGEYDGGTGKAGEAVTAYLEALQRGDAKTALSLGRDQPPDTSMLTDEILKKQMEKFPITDVKILGDIPTTSGGAMVHVIAKVGGVDSDERIVLEKPPPGQGWKLDSAAMSVEFKIDDMNPDLAKSITVWDKPVPKSGKAYVFPGLVEMGSSNPALEVDNSPAVGNADPTLYEISTMSRVVYPDIKVSDDGRQIVRDELKKALEKCAESSSLEPPKCPNKAARSDFVPDSAQWTAPSDLDAITINFMDEKTGKVKIIGNAEFGISVRTESGSTETGTFLASVFGTADMTENPPVIDFDRA
ncbi:hypothetical protein [Mycobacterium sp. DBP42]|uniref:hypothetical protein n=1 Tax=Mycobacterium sp. DBP42 TaxID=2545267 RepID=UPI00110D0F5D|nr:hypothetical protein [Mycobacterium sp. DBP42]TMS54839.1 hypothetical protein E0T84_04590 [Mycobacterium sp. DBP42]